MEAAFGTGVPSLNIRKDHFFQRFFSVLGNFLFQQWKNGSKMALFKKIPTWILEAFSTIGM